MVNAQPYQSGQYGESHWTNNTNPNKDFSGSTGTKAKATTFSGSTVVTFGDTSTGSLGQSQSVEVPTFQQQQENNEAAVKEDQQKAAFEEQQTILRQKAQEQVFTPLSTQSENLPNPQYQNDKLMGFESKEMQQSVMLRKNYNQVQNEIERQKALHEENVKQTIEKNIEVKKNNIQRIQSNIDINVQNKKLEYEQTANANNLTFSNKFELAVGYFGLATFSGAKDVVIHPVKTAKGVFDFYSYPFKTPAEKVIFSYNMYSAIKENPVWFAGSMLGQQFVFSGIGKGFKFMKNAELEYKTEMFNKDILMKEAQMPKYEYTVNQESPGYNMPVEYLKETQPGKFQKYYSSERQLTILQESPKAAKALEGIKPLSVVESNAAQAEINSIGDLTRKIAPAEHKIPNIEKPSTQIDFGAKAGKYYAVEIETKQLKSESASAGMANQQNLAGYKMVEASKMDLIKSEIKPNSFVEKLLGSKKAEFNLEALSRFREKEYELSQFGKIGKKLKGEEQVNPISAKFTGKKPGYTFREVPAAPMYEAGNYGQATKLMQKAESISNIKEKTETKPTIKEKTNLLQHQELTNKQMIKPLQIAKQFILIEQKQKPATMQKLGQQSMQRTNTIQLSGQKQTQEQVQKQEQLQEQIQKQEQIQEQVNISKQIMTPVEIPKTTKQKIPTVPIVQINESRPQEKAQLFVRRKGIFQKIGQPTSYKEAYFKGINIARNTAAASIKIETNNPHEEILNPQFYQSKREPGVIIQKNQFRISSAGEKREIPGKAKMINIFRRG